MSSFAGDRASNLNRLVKEVAATGRYRIVLLMDVTSLAGTSLKASDALPTHLAPLVVPYTKGQIEKVSYGLALRVPVLIRGISLAPSFVPNSYPVSNTPATHCYHLRLLIRPPFNTSVPPLRTDVSDHQDQNESARPRYQQVL